MKGRPPCALRGSLTLLIPCCYALGPISLFCKPTPISGPVHLLSSLPEMPSPLTFPFSSFSSLETQPSVSSSERPSWVPSRAILITGPAQMVQATVPSILHQLMQSLSLSHRQSPPRPISAGRVGTSASPPAPGLSPEQNRHSGGSLPAHQMPLETSVPSMGRVSRVSNSGGQRWFCNTELNFYLSPYFGQLRVNIVSSGVLD